jgi:hypothetical protein
VRGYGKIAPQFWTGATGKALKAAGPEAVIVALYLMTSPHANMIGVYFLPKLYLGYETGLGIEGASKGLARAIEAGFCDYDEASEHVFVYSMARYQVGDSLTPGDKRCKGVENELAKLPKIGLAVAFRRRYAAAFHLQDSEPKGSPSEGASMPLASQEQEQEQEQEKHTGACAPRETDPPAGDEKPAAKPKRQQKPEQTLRTFRADGGLLVQPGSDPALEYAESIGLPVEFLRLAAKVFDSRYLPTDKRQRDWPAHFRNAVRGNWFKLWWHDGSEWQLTTTGKQAERELQALAEQQRGAA